jgi:hypothetical protein
MPLLSGRRYPEDRITHRHVEPNHNALLERPFLEALECVRARMQEWSVWLASTPISAAAPSRAALVPQPTVAWTESGTVVRRVDTLDRLLAGRSNRGRRVDVAGHRLSALDRGRAASARESP